MLWPKDFLDTSSMVNEAENDQRCEYNIDDGGE